MSRRTSKFVVSIFLVVIAIGISLLLSGCEKKVGSGDQDSKKAIALVTGFGGLGDNSFNDLGYSGAKRAATDFGLELSVTEPQDMAQLESVFREYAKMGKYGLIVGLGYEHVNAVEAAAKAFPKQNFAIIDNVVDLSNVASLTFRCEEQAFLMGVIAAEMTKLTSLDYMNPEKVIGVILGVDVPNIRAFAVGYEAGAMSVDPETKVLVGEVGAWNNPGKANEMAKVMNAQGADIVWHVAGGSGFGVFEAAKQVGFYSMGTDANQNGLDPERIMSSTIKSVDVAIYREAQALVQGNWSGGEKSLGLKEEGLDVTWEDTEVPIPDEVKERANMFKQQIINGMCIPATPAELESFKKELQE